MNDQPSRPTASAEATEREVRRRLAEARHDEPMPDEVAARMDRTLADLARDRAAEGPDGPPAQAQDDQGQDPAVLALAARRRRRVVGLLSAAAAVLVMGVGVNQVLGPSGGQGDAASSADAGASSAQAGGGDSLEARGQQDAPSDTTRMATPATGFALEHPVRVRADHFAADVARARQLAARPHGHDDGRAGGAGPDEEPYVCPQAHWGRGTRVPVRYDGRASVLLLRPSDGDTQVVDLFGCGSDSVLRSITLPSHD